MSLRRIAVTMGDPAGVGPELCLRLLGEPRVLGCCVPIVFGDVSVLSRVGGQCGLTLPDEVITLEDWPSEHRQLTSPAVLDCRAIDAAAVRPGRIDAACGRAAFVYIETAIRSAVAREVAAVVTGPIHKESLHRAGLNYPGHTEIFAEKSGAVRVCMMLTSEQITVSLVTTHLGYVDVPRRLTTERILEVIEMTDEAIRRLRRRPARLIVCGLNPHAGEHGLFGRGEEEKLIAPAVAAAREKGIQVEGPLPPDAAFLPGRRRRTDAYVCMYHDQGLIPLKMLAFDTAVNVTLGLPIIRTSVDHGTAFEIAWTGEANPESLIQAVVLALRLAGAET